MKKYKITWTETYTAEIEANTEEEAIQYFDSGKLFEDGVIPDNDDSSPTFFDCEEVES